MSTATLPQAAPDDRRFVSEAALDFLVMEMVQQMHQFPDGTEVDKEASYFKLETLGYRVGAALVEKFTKDRPRFLDNLDVVKFICKEFWLTIFKKQIDNLKTNHRVRFAAATKVHASRCQAT
ncbi:Trafficking protein particle complex subunit 33 [Rhizophlyctis rosea]|nr:Trafficking protein particle complex subunit 33 [Rhizophlyctis rosea]